MPCKRVLYGEKCHGQGGRAINHQPRTHRPRRSDPERDRDLEPIAQRARKQTRPHIFLFFRFFFHKTLSTNRTMTRINNHLLTFLSILQLCVAFSHRASIITGGNGYVAREVIHELLKQQTSSNNNNNGGSGVEEKQSIYCLVRPSRIESETQYWSQKSNCITILPYDMLDGGETIRNALNTVYGGENVVQACCVYHIASVFGPSEDHVQTANDNVKGTEDLVHAVAEYSGCRLVVTSSMAAVRGTGQEPLNGKYYTSKDWNDVSELGANWGASYQWSKAESERRAWDIAKKHDIPMNSICPSFVFGPPSDGKVSNSYSITLVGQWVHGQSPVQSRLCVDVRDCAKCIVMAGLKEDAIGQRFIVSKEARVPSQDMAEALKKSLTETGIGNADDISYDSQFQGGAIPIGSREVEAEDQLQKCLGVTLRPVQETISDMGRALLQLA